LIPKLLKIKLKKFDCFEKMKNLRTAFSENFLLMIIVEKFEKFIENFELYPQK
jgi:hypothetical protein